MKLKLVNNLNEADAARGQRIQKLKAIHDTMEAEFEKNNYSFKGDNDRGFYIQPKFGYLSKISVIIDENNDYNVEIFDAQGKAPKKTPFNKTISAKDFYAEWNKKICPAAIDLIFDINNNDISKLQNSIVNEAVPEFIGNILNKAKNVVKNTVNKVVDSRDEKAANKQETKEVKQKIKQLTASLENILKNKANKSKIQIETTISENNSSQIDFELKSDFILNVIYKTDYISTDKSITVSDCRTSLNDYNNIDCSVDTFIKFLNSKLNLKIGVKSSSGNNAKPGGVESTSGNNAKPGDVKSTLKNNAKPGGVEGTLKNILGDKILKVLGENLTEALNDKKIVDKYSKALSLVENDKQGAALVKHYFYANTDQKLELDELTATALYIDIAKRQSFKSHLLNIVIYYYDKYKDFVDLKDNLADLVEFLREDNFIKNKYFDKNSIIFNKAFFNSNIFTDDLQDIYRMHKQIQNNNFTADKIKKALEQLHKDNPAINLAAAEKITSVLDLANYMVLDGDKIRNIDDIEEIYHYLTYGELKTIKAKKLNVKEQSAEITKLLSKFKDIFNKGDESDIKDIMSSINELKPEERQLALNMFANLK